VPGDFAGTVPSRRKAEPLAISPSQEADQLAARVVKAMDRAWERGEQPRAEDILTQHPDLVRFPRAVVRVIYEEVCLREEHGETLAPSELIARFPQWQAELELLLDCHGLMLADQEPTAFPKLGEVLGDFRLLALLGRGAQGRVFLAAQLSLGDRLVVLKVSPRDDGDEHLSLARLQHTAIVPLYAAYDFPERNLHALCMPYFGGASLSELLDLLRTEPQGQRSGSHLVGALATAQAAVPVAVPVSGPVCKYFARLSYAQALCWIGAALADGLQYAHERGLVHLDLKPSNVLLAADGQPMLLDFHVARDPLAAGAPTPEWLGGTPLYMSPEQEAAVRAVREGKPVPAAVDGRSDIYSLGLVLYEALGGTFPLDQDHPRQSLRTKVQVSRGLADILRKCLAHDPTRRYADAATLAEDLRRHLHNQPLQGVPNRSAVERWRKWRRRRPHTFSRGGILLSCAILVVGGGLVAGLQVRQRAQDITGTLAEAQEQLRLHHADDAVATLNRGLALTQGLPLGGELAGALEANLQQAQRVQWADRLHEVADQIRFAASAEHLEPATLRNLEASCREIWAERDRARQSHSETSLAAGLPLEPETERRMRMDLLDLALLDADLRVRLAPPETAAAARRDALDRLAEVEALLGPSLVLALERQRYAEALGLGEVAQQAAQRVAGLVPRTAREYFALGRTYLRTGKLAQAAAALDRAIDLQPRDFWTHFTRGMCAHRQGRPEEALAAFSACVALNPHPACYLNRALAETALGKTALALKDYDRALERDPGFGAAALNRGILRYRERRYREALADFDRALAGGANPPDVHYNRALVYQAERDLARARQCLRQALASNPRHQDARALYERLAQ
jgi:serine/threonine protein kinase/tetratricopeptide (TPR) repeat protein